jgi:hypothetical protein
MAQPTSEEKAHWSDYLAAAREYGAASGLGATGLLKILLGVTQVESGGGTTSQTYLGYGGGSGPAGIPQAQYAGWKNQIFDAAHLLSQFIPKYGETPGIAAYNAGPGDIRAGLGYAETVENYAAQYAVSANKATSGGSGRFRVPINQGPTTPHNLGPHKTTNPGIPNPLSGLGSIASSIGTISSTIGATAANIGKAKDYALKHPWVIIIAIAALVVLIAGAKGLVTSAQGGVTPVPVPV